MSEIPGDCCGKCRFLKPDMGDLRRGICRRYPPGVVPAQTAQGIVPIGFHPVCSASDWCGEFSPRPGLNS